jgi:hypothetical protein
MTTAALPTELAATKMALGVSLFLVFAGTAIPRHGTAPRRLATLESRIEVVDHQMLRTVRSAHAGRLSPERARAERARLTAVRTSLLGALQSVAEQRADEESDASLLLAGSVFGLLLFGNGYRQNNAEYTRKRARIAAADLFAVHERQSSFARRSASRVAAIESGPGVSRRNHGTRPDDVRLTKRAEYVPAREVTFDREPQDLHHAVLRIRHLTGEHVAVPRELQLRAAHAIADSDSPEAALRALRVSGVLNVLDRAGANTTRLTGAIPEIWHGLHLELGLDAELSLCVFSEDGRKYPEAAPRTVLMNMS